MPQLAAAKLHQLFALDFVAGTATPIGQPYVQYTDAMAEQRRLLRVPRRTHSDEEAATVCIAPADAIWRVSPEGDFSYQQP